MTVEVKSAVTVSEMARMVGLSRARFYQLIGTAFPYPLYNRCLQSVHILTKVCKKSVWKCGGETAGSTASRFSSTPVVSIYRRQKNKSVPGGPLRPGRPSTEA